MENTVTISRRRSGRLRAIAAAGAITALALTAASAQSLKEMRAQDAEENALEREASFTRSVCDMNFDVVIEWRSAANWPDGESLANACDGALGALEAACRKGDAPRISRFVCAGDGSGASLRGGTLRYGAEPGGNGFSETRDALEAAR